MKNKFLSILFISLISLTSCSESIYMTDFTPITCHTFTNWVRDDGRMTLVAQGLGRDFSGFAYVEGQDLVCRYYTNLVDIYSPQPFAPLYVVSLINDAYSSFKVLKATKEEVATNGFVAIRGDKNRTRYVFKPTPVKIEEIDLRFFTSTNLISIDNKYEFLYDGEGTNKNLENGYNCWFYEKWGSDIRLTFGENNSFEIEKVENPKAESSFYRGVYDANFKSVTLNFENSKNIFNEDSIELFYEYGFCNKEV